MNKKLQDYVWSVLPKEFKEEVKYEYYKTKTKKIKKECDLGFLNAHEGMFGVHNLTSDAEGEEMLTVPRKKVKEKWQRACEQEAIYGRAQDSPVAREELYYNRGILSILDTLFGTKCLTDVPISEPIDCDNPLADKDGCRWHNDGKCTFDNACYFEPLNPQEPKPAEPKFKVGDIVRFKYCCTAYRIYGFKMSDGVMLYQVGDVWAEESNLEPYTEPTANYVQVDYHGADTAASTIADSCQSQPVTDYFDRILKDGFRGHNRLHIAAQIVAAIYANYQAAKGFKSIEEIVRKSLDIADTLIKESEKGCSK